MKLKLVSAGKSEVLAGKVAADLYIDCRGMINPFRDPVLGGLTGDDPKVQDWVRENNSEYIDAALYQIGTALKSATTRNSFKRDPLKPLTVCFFCLAGVHRSRGLKNVVAQTLIDNGIPDVEVA